jgi:hypothetical protein
MLTTKVHLIIKYLYTNGKDNFDWYPKGDDDTYVFMDHLREFLSDKNRSKPVTYGYDFNT